MSDTPLTDRVVEYWSKRGQQRTASWVELRDTSRRLERELAEARRDAERLEIALGALADIATMSKREVADGVAQRKAKRVYDELRAAIDASWRKNEAICRS